jgi:hypothetical protein
MQLRLISRLALFVGRFCRATATITVAWFLMPSTEAGAFHSGAEITFSAYLTGYSDGDNTPPGSDEISNPVVHQKAGGTGTYQDPVTVAVGHVIQNGTDTLDHAPGTIFYLSFLRKYAVVEDTCGDGNRPQNEPCHVGYRGHPWLDLYVGGGTTSRSHLTRCMNSITAIREVIQNPAPDYPVEAGGIARSGCRQFDNRRDKRDGSSSD